MFPTPPSLFAPPTYLRKKLPYAADQPPLPQDDEAPAHEEPAQQQPPQLQSMPGQVKSYKKALLQRAQSTPQVQTQLQRNAAPQDPPPSHLDESEVKLPTNHREQQNLPDPGKNRIPANTIPLRPKETPPDYLRRFTVVGQPKGTLSKFLQLRPGPYSAATPPSYATPAATQAPDPTAAQPLPAAAAPQLETGGPNAQGTPPVTAQPALPDPEQQRQAAIAENLNQWEQAGRQRQDQLRNQGAEHARQQTQQEALLQPVQQRLEAARQAHAALADAPVRYEKRGGSMVSTRSDDTGAVKVLPVDPANPKEMQQAAGWMQQQDAAKAELAAAEAAHAPLAAGVQSLKDQHQSVAKKLMEANRWTQSRKHYHQHSASDVKGPPPPFDPAPADRQLLAQLQAQGHPLAAAVKEEMTPPSVRQFQARLDQATPGTPMALLDVVTGGTPGSGTKATRQDAAAARDLTLKTFGLFDPKNVTLTLLPDGTHALHWPRFGGTAPVAIYDPRQKSLTVQAENGTLSEGTRLMLQHLAVPPSRPGAKPPAESMPVYFGNGPRINEAGFAALLEAGEQAHKAARTPEERAAAMERLGLTPAGVKKQWESGTISLQQGLALNGIFNNVMEPNTTLTGVDGAMQDWTLDPKHPDRPAWLNEGTPEQRAYVINEYFNQTTPRTEGSLLANPERMEELRRRALADIRPEWGRPGAASPGSRSEDGPPGIERIPLQGGGAAHIPSGTWTAHDYETLDQHPEILKLPHAEREDAVDTLLSDYHDQLTSQPGFSAADQQKFNETADALRARVAGLKTAGDYAGEGADLVKEAAKSEAGSHAAAAADLAFFDPEWNLRMPGKNLKEQSVYEAQKAKDAAQRKASPIAEKKIDAALEALRQDVRNGNFPVGDPEAQEKWIDEMSAKFNPQREQWFEAVQGKPDPSTPEGKKYLAHMQERTLTSPENRALLQEYIRTGNKARWKELEHNLKMTPQRAQTDEDQAHSLKSDPLVSGLSNMTGTDFTGYMQEAPATVAGDLMPAAKFSKLAKFGKFGKRLGKYGGKAVGIAANIGGTVVQNTIENPDADFEDHKNAVIADYATSYGMKPLHYAAGKAGQKIKDQFSGRRSAENPGSTGSAPPPSDGQTFDERRALEEGSMPLPRMDTPQAQQPGDATGQPPPASQQTIPDTTTPTAPGSRSAQQPQTPTSDRESAATARTTTPGAPQAPHSTSGPRLQFSQGSSEKKNAGQVMQSLAGDEDRFRRGKASQSKDFGEITKEYALPGEITGVHEQRPFGNESTEKIYKIDLAAGGHAYLLHGTNGKVWVDTSKVRTKDGQPAAGGDLVYQAAMTYAHNNGLKFVEDHRGTSTIADFRRISQMLSNALRHGSTEHLSPKGIGDEDQKYASIPGFRQQQGSQDTAAYEHNVNLLAHAEMKQVENVMRRQAEYDQRRRQYAAKDGKPLPEPGQLDNVQLQDLKWNPEDDTVTYVPTGRRLSKRDFKQIVSGLDPGGSGVGETTLSRALIARQALLGNVPGGYRVPNLESEEPGGSGRREIAGDGDMPFKLFGKNKRHFYSLPGGANAGRLDEAGGGSGPKLASHFGTDSRGLAEQTAQTAGTLNQRVPGLLHDKTHVFHSVEDLLNSDYAKQHPFSKEDLAGLQNAEGFHDPKTGHSAIIAGNVELRPGETPHDALTRVILHERVGHDGLQTLLGSKDSKAQKHWESLTQRIKPEELNAIARQDGYQHLAGDHNALAHEWFARQAEKYPHMLKQPGLVRDMWEAFKGQLKKLNSKWKDTPESHLDAHLHELMRLSRKTALRPKTATSTSRSGSTSAPAAGRGPRTPGGIAAPPVGHGNLIPVNTTHPGHIDLANRRTENLEKIASKRPLNPHEQQVYANARRIRDRNASAPFAKETPGILQRLAT
ncbi:MAG: hypothetical protein K9N47_29400 [Prosthecobacter sp.]|uniref:hypothetical protein n=1 Tax=Prosthecobacter sp. TaxID=1965333 RepID=UPI00260EEE20|nr:hypothetical protein [Prosthecobacter sp.]MCF7790272.1 hypothetical protein [Prosthecobacter sp.]